MANEKRLIDANALMEHLNRCIEQSKGLMKSVCVAIKCFVEQMPTVDAVEVVHARWENIKHFGGADCFGYCSNCKTPQKSQNATALKELHRYCRWCGAKMDGGNEDA